MLALAGYLFSMYGYYIILNVSRGAAAGGSTDGGGGGVPAGRWENRVVVEVEEGRNRGNRVEHGKEITRHEGFTILLMLFLCVHSVIEGIYTGEATSNAETWGYLRQIIPFNIFASLARGITILSLIPKRPFLSIVVYTFAFGISNTIGIAIGIAVNVFAYPEGTVLDWIYAISTGIACGALMYIAIHHIICKGFKPQEDSNSDTQFIKFLAYKFVVKRVLSSS